MDRRQDHDEPHDDGPDEDGPDDNGPDDGELALEEHERRHAGTGPTPPSARIIHEIIREDGEEELARSVEALAWSASGAGLSMGFSFLTMAILKSALPDAPWAKLVTGFGYTIGFLIVVLGRQQLFTESTLTAVLPLLTRKDAKTAYQTARLWVVVLVCNLAGTVVFAWLISHPGLFDAEVDTALRTLAAEASADPFWPMFTKSILAGWLIALMVWLIPGAGPARLWLILILTYVVAIAHFSHIIAGSVEAAFNVFVGHFGAMAYVTHFLVPTLLGNTIGGVSLVAILNHVPVRDELPGGAKEKRSK